MRGTYILLLAFACGACGDNGAGEDRLGGATTVDDHTQQAFMHPAANLSAENKQLFQAGSGPFDFHWGPDRGLGPLFNNDSCFGCHDSNGRGLSAFNSSTDQFGPQSTALVRVSLPAADGSPADPGGDVPVPSYGLQLHDHATVGLPQVVVTLSWAEEPGTFMDGTPYSLRHPLLVLAAQDGTMPDDTMTSYRIAPPILGLGLLDAIDEGTLSALEDPDDRDGDGISGRGNVVWNPETQAMERGRFGWKANVPRLEVQAAGAAFNDMGLTNQVFATTDGSDNDVSDLQLSQMTFFVSTVGVPSARPRSDAAWRGRELFEHFNCSGCHVPTLVTGDHSIAEVSHQTIHPYTDLLLHDMGDGLADERPDFGASGSEWRTPPLWGIGLAQVVDDGVTFLHDGRARTLEEAILWHGGEAQTARDAFAAASASDRAALLAFLQTL